MRKRKAEKRGRKGVGGRANGAKGGSLAQPRERCWKKPGRDGWMDSRTTRGGGGGIRYRYWILRCHGACVCAVACIISSQDSKGTGAVSHDANSRCDSLGALRHKRWCSRVLATFEIAIVHFRSDRRAFHDAMPERSRDRSLQLQLQLQQQQQQQQRHSLAFSRAFDTLPLSHRHRVFRRELLAAPESETTLCIDTGSSSLLARTHRVLPFVCSAFPHPVPYSS